MFFGYNNVDPANVRNKADIGGGGLYDIGCYAIVAGRFFFEAEPARGIALVDRDPAFRTDRLTSGLVDFGDGRRLDFTVSTQIAPHQRLQLCGTKGRIEIPIPVNAPQGAPTRILIDDCRSLDGAGIVAETLPASDQYQLQGEAFSRAVRGEIALPYGDRGRDRQHARHRRAVPLREERRVGGGRRAVTPTGRRESARRARGDVAPRQRTDAVRGPPPVRTRHLPGVVPAQRVNARTNALASV